MVDIKYDVRLHGIGFIDIHPALAATTDSFDGSSNVYEKNSLILYSHMISSESRMTV